MVEVWGGHQMPDLYQALAAQVAGVPPEQVRLHVMMSGGSFGRRATPDADVIVEAVATAKAIGWRAPVKVQWTREDDMTGGRYRPAYLHKLEAALDADGKVSAWRHRVVGQSILAGSPFAAFMQNGIDPTSVEGASNLPYAMPNFRVELATTEVGVPVLWWRAVGSTHTAYAAEVFLDEVAQAAGQDPIAFRLAMLQDKPRHRAVLEKARDASGWGSAPPEGRARGVALAESFSTYVAQVAEVSVEDGQVRVHKVTCAVDCGIAINPDVIHAQMQGGIGFGLGAILKGAVTLDQGRVVETNFDGYDVLRIAEMPQVEVHVMPSTELPAGRRRARRAADRPRGRQRRGGAHRQAGAGPAVQPERPALGLSAFRCAAAPSTQPVRSPKAGAGGVGGAGWNSPSTRPWPRSSKGTGGTGACAGRSARHGRGTWPWCARACSTWAAAPATLLHGSSVVHRSGVWTQSSQPRPGSGDADVARASQLQHAVERVSGDRHLGRPALVGARAQPVADHLFPPCDGGLGFGAPVVP